MQSYPVGFDQGCVIWGHVVNIPLFFSPTASTCLATSLAIQAPALQTRACKLSLWLLNVVDPPAFLPSRQPSISAFSRQLEHSKEDGIRGGHLKNTLEIFRRTKSGGTKCHVVQCIPSAGRR